MRGHLQWLVRIMYILPIFLCISITLVTIIKVTEIELQVEPTQKMASTSDEEILRGQEVLDKQRELDKAEREGEEPIE